MLELLNSGDYSGQMLPYKAALMFVPLCSVFLGMLFGLRYHASYEELDQGLREIGHPGLTPGQERYLFLARTLVLGGVFFFIVCLIPFLLFGISFKTQENQWLWQLACGGHFVMSMSLFIFGMLDMKIKVNRFWLRGAVLVLGLAGIIGAPFAAFLLSSSLMPL